MTPLELGTTNDALGQTTTLISNGAVPAALQVSNPGGVSFASALQAVGGENGVRAFARRVAVRGSGQLPGATGVRGEAEGHGVTGFSTGGISDGGVFGQGRQANGNGVIGQADNGTLAFGIWGKSTSGFAGVFTGKVAVTGQLTKSGGGFKIDHPLDPENKYLLHSFVESPEALNVYSGNATTDQDGNAVVALPDYFEALNQDFRYQLTVIGELAQAVVAEEPTENRFAIKTDRPNVKVSWQVTGVRKDAYASMYPMAVEEDKEGEERGTYLHPEAFDQPEERGEGYAREQELRSHLEEMLEAQPLETEEEATR